MVQYSSQPANGPSFEGYLTGLFQWQLAWLSVMMLQPSGPNELLSSGPLCHSRAECAIDQPLFSSCLSWYLQVYSCQVQLSSLSKCEDTVTAYDLFVDLSGCSVESDSNT